MGDYTRVTDSGPKLSARELSELNTPEEGLSLYEANSRLSRDGPNLLPEKATSPFARFLSHFWGPIPWVIWTAIVIELANLDWLDLIILASVLVLNSFISWYQEESVFKLTRPLKEKLAPETWVKREGNWLRAKANQLVIGDRIPLKPGNVVPADCILGPGCVEIDQSLLNKELVTKYEGEVVFQGSIVRKGEVDAIVSATGTRTFFRKTLENLNEVAYTGNFQKVLLKVTAFVVAASSVLVLVILIVVLSKGNNFLESLSICVAVFIACAPIDMKIVCTATLAVGTKLLAAKQAVVKNLDSIEQLARMEVLCLNKTGTLSKDLPTVQGCWPLLNYTQEDLLLNAKLASRTTGNSLDKCIIESTQSNFDHFEQEEFIDFSPDSKRTEATVRNTTSGETFKCTKGAPQVVLALCGDLEEEVSNLVDSLAAKGLRTLGVAKTDSDGVWNMCGIISISDPLQSDSKKAIQQAISIGIEVKMLTGDQSAIAKEISRVLELKNKVYNSDFLSTEIAAVNCQLLEPVTQEASGFSEVFPEHKFAIVKLLQSKGTIVGFTGRSAEDCPTLEKANVGIAVHGAVDSAQLAADLILESPGASVIVKVVKKCRKIFQRIVNYCTYRVTCSLQLLGFFFIAMVGVNPKSTFTCQGHSDCGEVPNTFALPVIALAVIIFLSNLTVVSGVYDKSTGSQKPQRWNLTLVLCNSCLLGTVDVLSSVILLLVCLSNMNNQSPSNIFQGLGFGSFSYGEVLTIIYLKVSLSSFLTPFVTRTQSFFFSKKPGKLLVLVFVSAGVISTLFAKYWFLSVSSGEHRMPGMKQVSWGLVVLVWVYSLFFCVLQDVLKVAALSVFENYYSLHPEPRLDLSESFVEFSKDSFLTERSVLAASSSKKWSFVTEMQRLNVN